MSNQFHRLLTQQELHRPELSGVGDPNEITRIGTDEASFEIPPEASENISTDNFIFNPEDGLYYQDVSTGDIYRYTKYASIPLSESQGYLIGTVSESISAGQDVEFLSLENPDAGPATPVIFFEQQVVSLQTISGDFEKLVIAKSEEVTRTSFRLEVVPFTAKFDIGGANAASVLASNGDGQWERIIAYDRANQSITNTAFKQQSSSIGVLTQGFGGEEIITTTVPETFIYRDRINDKTFDTYNEALDSTGLDRTVAMFSGAVESIRVPATIEKETRQRAVTSIRANLNSQVLEGQEITVLNEETGDFIFLTLETQAGAKTRTYGPGEDITLDVQDDRTDKVFPAGSLIFSQAGFIESTFKVDPSRIQQGVREVRAADSIGVVQDEIFKDPLTVLNLDRIKEEIELKDGQPLILVNDDGLTRTVTVDGAQSLDKVINKSVTIQELNPMAQQEAIATINEDLTTGTEHLEIAVTAPVSGTEIRQHQILNLVNESGEFREVAALVDQVIDESTTIIQVKDASSGGVNSVKFEEGDTEFFAGQSFIKLDPPRFDYEEFVLKEPSYISTSRINVNENSIVSLTSFTNNINSSLAQVSQKANSNQANISSLTSFTNGINNSLALVEQKANANESSITDLTSFTNDINDSLALVEQKANSNEASITQSVQFDDSSGEVRLVAGPGGSEFSVVADQVNISGQTNFSSDLYDPSTKETPAGAQGKADNAQNNAINISRAQIATNLGYTTYEEMNEEARKGKTIIDGGLIRTSLIEVNDLFAQNALISGSLTVGTDTETGIEGLIQSDGFTTGVKGFQINADGSAEFQEVSIGGSTSSIGNGATLNALTINGTLTIDDANGSIQSTGFSSGSSGFKIEGDGNAEFQSVTIGGSSSTVGDNAVLENLSIEGALTINTGGAIQDSGYSAGTSGFQISADGSAEFNDVTVRGTVEADAGEISGDLLFTGKLTGNNFKLDGSISNVNEGNILEVGDSFIIDGGGGLEADGFFELGGESPTVQGIINQGSDGAMIQYGDDSDTLGLDANFKGISVGTVTNGTNLKVNGFLDVDGDIECVSLTETSDRYQKENIEPLGSTLGRVTQLEAKTFDMIGPSTERKMGLLAQDVEPLFPEAVGLGSGTNSEGETIEYKTLSYTQLVPALIESIKELKQQNEELKTRIEALEQQS